MLEGSFEPTIMFFGLINSLTILQIIMNKILQDLVNTGEVACFIDDVILGTEKKEGYNKVVEEIMKRLVENNLYVELEKCK